MTRALDGAVELLERSLVLTGGVLRGVEQSPVVLRSPTPCAGWDLERLLDHMDDALDAFTEAASGAVPVHAVDLTGRRDGRVEVLQAKACALLGAWVAATDTRVQVGAPGRTAGLDAPLLVATAALEITVHGWDVARATGQDTRIPADLAAGLLGVAHGLVGPADRVHRFAAPLHSPGRLAPDERLLSWLGRVPPTPAGELRFWGHQDLRTGT